MKSSLSPLETARRESPSRRSSAFGGIGSSRLFPDFTVTFALVHTETVKTGINGDEKGEITIYRKKVSLARGETVKKGIKKENNGEEMGKIEVARG